jgi:hypothetical protein
MIAGDIRSGLEMRTKFHERRAAKKKKAVHCIVQRASKCLSRNRWLAGELTINRHIAGGLTFI